MRDPTLKHKEIFWRYFMTLRLGDHAFFCPIHFYSFHIQARGLVFHLMKKRGLPSLLFARVFTHKTAQPINASLGS